MSSTQNKQRNQKIVLDLASLPGNNICADCKARLPRWTSYNLGIFICVNCAGIHRKMGTHISKVKSLTIDDWTKEQVETMKSMGNVKSNAIYNPNEFRNPPPPNLEDPDRDSDIEKYIRSKYEYKKFLDRSALVASRLGPSRSATLGPSRSAPFPQPAGPLSRSSTNSQVAASNASTSSHTAPPTLPQGSSRAQPPQPPQQPQQPQPPHPSGGVWDDINSLKGNSQNSSLPLQYDQPTFPPPQGNPSMQMPDVRGAMGANVYPVAATASGMGLNPYQPVRLNPFSPELSQPPFAAPSTSSFSTTSTMNSQPYGYNSVSQSSPLVHQPVAPAYLHQQPQTSMPMQNSSGQGFMSGSSSRSFPSAPTGQSPFLPHGHSPIQQPHISQSPQQLQPSSSAHFMHYSSPASTAPPQTGGHNVSGHTQFLGMTTMEMHQQAFQQQQQQQQMQMQQQQQMHQQMHQQQIHQTHQQQIHQTQPQQLGQSHFSSMQMQQQQMQHHHQPQQVGQTNFSSAPPQMMSGQVSNGYGQTSVYPQGPYAPRTGG